MALATNLGFPRIGARRELKKSLESYWRGEAGEDELEASARSIRQAHWTLQKELGLDHIPSNDFSLYDQVLDTTVMVGAVPPRYNWDGQTVDLATYFAMSRGAQTKEIDAPAMEITKWFDTNYHYIVPEFHRRQTFRLAGTKPIDEFLEAKALGIQTRPVLLGPVSYLLLGKARDRDLVLLDLIDGLLPVYEEVLRRLLQAGADWVQIDEPCLVLDLDDQARACYRTAFDRLAKAAPNLRLLLASYFGSLKDNLATAAELPVAALHLDLVRAPEQLEAALEAAGSKIISLGLIDGRNVWRADLRSALDVLERAEAVLGKDRIMVAPSCSLLHTPLDLELETRFDQEFKSWLAFAEQKISELVALAKGLRAGRDAVREELAASDAVMQSRRESPRIHDDAVAQRLASITPDMMERQSPSAERCRLQAEHLKLPPLPTTTIGSFPQTTEVRKARAELKRGQRDIASYESFLREETARTVRWQEEIGLDVLVHGEYERNDMVQYFGEQLTGFAITEGGWVQSYGSRCVKPPIIFGDVSRPAPMTVEWSEYAQSLTARPLKGMLTGPVTMMQWSFVRDDQPRDVTCRQIALALRDEVRDLEAAGIRIIQIDEPALREGLPLKQADWQGYLSWAVECFRLTTSGVRDQTQIHTHMCYAEFNDIIGFIGKMDADVTSIEASRSQMRLLDAFADYRYPSDIGPGVYDIHSPRTPSVEEMVALLHQATQSLAAEQLWVNPDCGLKTRSWDEVRPALINMVEAARRMRSEFASPRLLRCKDHEGKAL